MTQQRSFWVWPTLGPALALAGYSFALLAARSVFGDLPLSTVAARQQAVAAIDFDLYFYSALSIGSLVAAVVVAILTRHKSRLCSRATLGLVGIFAFAVVVAAFYVP
jgi:hypothetical protein